MAAKSSISALENCNLPGVAATATPPTSEVQLNLAPYIGEIRKIITAGAEFSVEALRVAVGAPPRAVAPSPGISSTPVATSVGSGQPKVKLTLAPLYREINNFRAALDEAVVLSVGGFFESIGARFERARDERNARFAEAYARLQATALPITSSPSVSSSSSSSSSLSGPSAPLS